MPRAFENRENESRPERHEQDGHQPSGKIIRDVGYGGDRERVEVAHPAARVVVMAAEAQEREVGDGTNFVVSFAGELLSLAEELIRDGLHPSEIRDGYQKALEKCLEWLNEELAIEGTETMDLRDKVAVAKRLKGTLSSKQSGYEEQLASIVAEACVDVCPKKNAKNFNVEDVRTAKIVGGNINDVQTIHGMVIRRNVKGPSDT